MNSFSFSVDDLVRIVAALIADQMGRQYGRYTESVTLSRWTGETRLGRGGVEASTEQQEQCVIRVTQFFGRDEAMFAVRSGDTIGDWASRVQTQIQRHLRFVRFHPATQNAEAATRHHADDIFRDAAAVASLMQGRRRVVSMVSPHSLVGLVTSVLAPKLQRLEVVDGRGLTPDELGDRLTFGDIVVATPTLWRYLADTIPGIANNVMGLSFGERLGPDLAGRLRQRGLGAMRELYGSTESGVVGWRDSAPDPFTLFDHWTREKDALTRQRPDGSAVHHIPMDDFEWHSDRAFDLGKRRDGAVQIGAVNVFPSAISSIIAEHESVERCTVRVSRRAGALDRLIADICLKSEYAPDQAMAWSIDEWCRDRLRPPERPRIYAFVDGLSPKGDR